MYPAKDGGIKATFPHQERNAAGREDSLWREGKLCLDSPVKGLGLHTDGPEPTNDAELRFGWQIRRALSWLNAAAKDELIRYGDPFELPKYPESSKSIQVIHDESEASFPAWLQSAERMGWVVLDETFPVEKSYFAVSFESFDRRLIRSSFRYLEKKHSPTAKERKVGVWFRFDKPIVLSPWQVPQTWGELRLASQKQAVDLDEILRQVVSHISGISAQILLLGYPIPQRKGEPDCEMHWKAVHLEKLERGKRQPKGFRPNAYGLWHANKNVVFAENKAISYLDTSNWHPDRLQARGRLSPSLRDRKIALVGCGALGSIVAELLARGGVRKMLLIDSQVLEAGNLVRHMLTTQDLNRGKAKALRERLEIISPYIEAKSLDHALPTNEPELKALLNEWDFIIDCTGEDTPLFCFVQCWWPIPKLFFSLCFGYMARRLYVFATDGNVFPLSEFKTVMTPWLDDEACNWREQGGVLEGAGCWSPLFPARFEDIMLGAATAVKLLDELASRRPVATELIVFEQEHRSGVFQGFKRVPTSRLGSSR